MKYHISRMTYPEMQTIYHFLIDLEIENKGINHGSISVGCSEEQFEQIKNFAKAEGIDADFYEEALDGNPVDYLLTMRGLNGHLPE